MTAARISISSSLHEGYDDLKILPYRFASKCLKDADGGQQRDARVADLRDPQILAPGLAAGARLGDHVAEDVMDGVDRAVGRRVVGQRADGQLRVRSAFYALP